MFDQHIHCDHKRASEPQKQAAQAQPDLSALTVDRGGPGASERIVNQGMEVLKAISGLSQRAAREETKVTMKDGEWQTNGNGVTPEQVKHLVVEIEGGKVKQPSETKAELPLTGYKTEEAALCSAYGKLIDKARANPEVWNREPEQREFKFTQDLEGITISHGDTVVGILPKNADAVVTFVREHGGGRHFDLEPFKRKQS